MKVKDTNQMLCSIISYRVKWTSEVGHKIETLEQLLQVGDSVRDFFAYIYNSRGITRDDLLGKLGWTNNGLAVRLKGGSIKETDIEHIARALNLSDNELLAFINFLWFTSYNFCKSYIIIISVTFVYTP